MKKNLTLFLIFINFMIIFSGRCNMAKDSKPQSGNPITIKLSQPRLKSQTSVEEALQRRKSRRSFLNLPLALDEVSQVLWSAQGITREDFYRTAPSPGALYPLEIYVFVGNVIGVSKGIYKYKPYEHELIKVADGDKRYELSVAALEQDFLDSAAIDILFCAVFERVTKKYGNRGITYVHIEVGHASQNVYLQCEALNLGTVAIGAFENEKVKKIFKMEPSEEPLYIMPIGRIKK